MITRKKRNFIIVTVIMTIVVIIVSGYVLYIKTDFLRSNNFLFTKYIAQNFNVMENIISREEENRYTNMLNESNYEFNSKFLMEYTENYNIDSLKKDNLINDFNIVVDGKVNNTDNIKSSNIKINDDNNNQILNLEYINQNNQMYSTKFINIFKQYISIQNTNLKELAEKLGIDSRNIPNQISGININQLLQFTDEEIIKIKNTYINAIIDNIKVDKFTKQKDAIITVDENSISTNAYILKLTVEELNNIYINILQMLKQDEILLNKIQQIENQIAQYIDNEQYIGKIKEKFIKIIDEEIKKIQDNNIGQDEIRITVFEDKGITIRTLIESKNENIKIDLQNNIENKSLKIQKNMNLEESVQILKLSKTGFSNSSNLTIDYQKNSNNNITGFNYNKEMLIDNNNLNKKIQLSYQDEKDKFKMEYIKQNNIVNDMSTISQVNEENNIILNNYNKEELNLLLNTIVEQVTNSLEEKVTNIKERFYSSIPDIDMSIVLKESDRKEEIEKNRFNAKFAFYESEITTFFKVEELLNIISKNLGSIEVLSGNEIKLNIQKGKEDKETVEKILQVMNKDKKYKIQINYDETNYINNVIIIILDENY